MYRVTFESNPYIYLCRIFLYSIVYYELEIETYFILFNIIVILILK